LIRGRGYAGFSYADLASSVGLRKASIHHHFPAKADLAVALLRAYDARYDAALADIDTSGKHGLARIHAYADLYLQGVEKGLGCLCAAFAAELAVLPEVLRSELTRFFAKHVGWIEDVIALGQRDRSIRTDLDAGAAARLVVAALEGALMMERTLDGSPGFVRVQTALEALLAG
jgi:TetR/AcrR family transcriptional regulator, transcriptional repressor for nem operon